MVIPVAKPCFHLSEDTSDAEHHSKADYWPDGPTAKQPGDPQNLGGQDTEHFDAVLLPAAFPHQEPGRGNGRQLLSLSRSCILKLFFASLHL